MNIMWPGRQRIVNRIGVELFACTLRGDSGKKGKARLPMNFNVAHKESKKIYVVHMKTCAYKEVQTLPPTSNGSVNSCQAHNIASFEDLTWLHLSAFAASTSI